MLLGPIFVEVACNGFWAAKSIRNPGDQMVRKPYFWSHNLIFGHHLRTGPHFSSLTLKI
jgi:hypothetical protein